MQPADVQLLLLNAAMAVVVSGLPNDGRQLVFTSVHRKGNAQRLQFKSEGVDQYDMSVLPQDELAEMDFSRQSGKVHECYVHTSDPEDKNIKLPCYHNTVGCVTLVNLTQLERDGWHGILPPTPFKKYICLNGSEAQRRPMGKCDCARSQCNCYCLGTNCNSYERITSITEDYGSHRQPLPRWATVMLVIGALIVAVMLLLLMFAVCGEVATKRSRYSRPPGRDDHDGAGGRWVKEEECVAEIDGLASPRCLRYGSEEDEEDGYGRRRNGKMPPPIAIDAAALQSAAVTDL